jgi:HEAT repeat protein
MNPLLVLALVTKMQDPSLTVAQRNEGCYGLRGLDAPPILRVLRQALDDQAVRACAGINLRIAGAITELKDALTDPDPQARALAARQLGAFEKLELLPVLAEAARDQQLLVAVNAVEGLANYGDPAVIPYLLVIAKLGGIAGTAALNRALEFRDPRVPIVARDLLARPDVSDKLAGMRVLAQMGDATDLAKLKEIARAETQTVAAQNRGFGLIPAISLSKAAQTTIEAIEQRIKSSHP